MKGGFFGSMFDFDHDGRLDAFEQAMDFMAFTHMVGSTASSREEAIDELASMGIDVDGTGFADLNGVLDEFDFDY